MVAGVAIATIGNAVFAFSQLQPDATISARLLREGTIWLLLALVIFHALRIEKLPAATIGLRPFGWRLGLAAALGLVLVAALLIQIVKASFHLETGNHLIAMLVGMPPWMLVLLSLRAGFAEEIIFRGYLLDRLTRLSGSQRIGVASSLALFVGMHLGGWNAIQLAPVALAGALYTALYLWKRNVMICVVVHATIDIVLAFALVPGAGA